MAWPQFEVGLVLALSMSFVFTLFTVLKRDACSFCVFCQQPRMSAVGFPCFVFAHFCLYLLLILFGGCRSTRRSSARLLRDRRRIWVGWQMATSPWSTREASVTIYLYVHLPTSTHRWCLSLFDNMHHFHLLYFPYFTSPCKVLCSVVCFLFSHPLFVQEYNVKPSKTAVNGGSKPATSLHNSGYTSQPER